MYMCTPSKFADETLALPLLAPPDTSRRSRTRSPPPPNQCYAVTWHGSEAAAQDAAAKPYKWCNQGQVIGVFAVSA